MECPTVPWDCGMGWTIYNFFGHLFECQALKKALESVYQSQERRVADCKHRVKKKVLETPEESQRLKEANAKCHAYKTKVVHTNP